MRRIAAAILGLAMAVAVASPAHAVKPFRFEPGPNPDLVIRTICPFPVRFHDVVNELHVTDFFDRDGNLVRESGNGRIVEDVSRMRNGQAVETIRRNISGPGTFTFDDDGFTLVARGAWLFFFEPGQVTNLPDGIVWFTTGRFVWRFTDATGRWRLVSAAGRHTDVCALLA